MYDRFKDDIYKSPDLYVTDLAGRRKGPEVLRIFYMFSLYSNNPAETADIFYPLFEDANKSGAKTSEDFRAKVVESYRKAFDSVKPEMPENVDAELFFNSFLKNLASKDFESNMTKRGAAELQTRACSSVEGFISLSKIAKRLKNEMIEHLQESRRMVLGHYLSRINGVYRDYEEIVMHNEQLIEGMEERRKRLIDLNAPKGIIASETELVESQKYIRHCLGAEKNWVERVLMA